MKKGVMMMAHIVMATTLGAKQVYVNEVPFPEERMEITFLQQPEATNKSDAALVVDYTQDGAKVFLVDGGMPNCTALKALWDLRADLLLKMGKKHEERNPDYKLRFSCLITHCHPDHIDELTNHVMPSKLLELEDLYLPEATGLATDGSWQDNHNSDMTQRVALMAQIAQYQKQASIHEVPFGTKEEVPIAEGSIEMYGPVVDWGKNAALKAIIDTYYAEASPEKRKSDVPTAVINSNSVWYRIIFQHRSILFTGDVLKKAGREDEPFDRMIDGYGADHLRSDIVKYPHHGILRNPAAPRLVGELMIDARNSFVVVSAQSARRESVPVLESFHVPVRDSSKKSVRFSIAKSEITELP